MIEDTWLIQDTWLSTQGLLGGYRASYNKVTSGQESRLKSRGRATSFSLYTPGTVCTWKTCECNAFSKIYFRHKIAS